ncbi:MAG: hypothetical protein KDA34_14945, partial [Phycisphaerales bacterium]|nr:hypothetical protein [Phycisphaerales bacterium]
MRYTSVATLVCCAAATAQPSFSPIGSYPGGQLPSVALGVSGDGSTVVAYGGPTSGLTRAFRWTVQTGTVGLGSLPGGNDVSHAQGVNYDGSVIVGFAVGSTGG